MKSNRKRAELRDGTRCHCENGYVAQFKDESQKSPTLVNMLHANGRLIILEDMPLVDIIYAREESKNRRTSR